MELSTLTEGLASSEPPSFRVTSRKKKDGGKRTIMEPNASMREIHERFSDYLRGLAVFVHMSVPKHLLPDSGELQGAIGSIPNRDVLDHVRAHAKNRYYWILDLKKAFPSLTSARLAKVLCECAHGLRFEPTREFLEKYCFDVRVGLVQGAPSSPDLFNIYCHQTIDLPLREIFVDYAQNFSYTRHVDDLVISSDRPILVATRARVRALLGRAHFQINDWKSKVLDRRRGPIHICGFCIGVDGAITVPRAQLKRLEAELHRLVKYSDVTTVKPQTVLGRARYYLEMSKRLKEPTGNVLILEGVRASLSMLISEYAHLVRYGKPYRVQVPEGAPF